MDAMRQHPPCLRLVRSARIRKREENHEFELGLGIARGLLFGFENRGQIQFRKGLMIATYEYLKE